MKCIFLSSLSLLLSLSANAGAVSQEEFGRLLEDPQNTAQAITLAKEQITQLIAEKNYQLQMAGTLLGVQVPNVTASNIEIDSEKGCSRKTYWFDNNKSLPFQRTFNLAFECNVSAELSSGKIIRTIEKVEVVRELR